MIYAFICLFIALTIAQGTQTTLVKRLKVDIDSRPAGWGAHIITDFWASKHHDSACFFFFWQKKAEGGIAIRGVSAGIFKSKYIDLNFKTNMNHPLFISTTCGDGAWFDAFDLQLRTGSPKFELVDRRKYGVDNTHGWCVSTEHWDWKYLAGNVPEKTCYQTLELQAFNEVDLGPQGTDTGKVWGSYQSFWEALGRRVLDSEVKVNGFETFLHQYFQCVQTLGDDEACESLSIAASERFDQGTFKLLSGGSDADESNAVLTNEMSEDADFNNRRKL